MANGDHFAAALRSQKAALIQLSQRMAMLERQNADLSGYIQQLESRPRSVVEEIDALDGRRLEGTLTGEIEFDGDDEFQQGNPIILQVSADGPFIMTHYPLVLWRPSAPDTATNLGRWRPVSTFPLPDQVVDTDIIDMMYELQDGGSGRLLQNAPRAPLFSRPDNVIPVAIPTMWPSNSTIKFTPTYLRFTWNAVVPPTAGILHVDMIGYHIANL